MEGGPEEYNKCSNFVANLKGLSSGKVQYSLFYRGEFTYKSWFGVAMSVMGFFIIAIYSGFVLHNIFIKS